MMMMMMMILQRKKRKRRVKRFWVRPWITRRLEYGFYDRLMNELQSESPTDFKNMLRIEPAMFQELTDRLTPRILKQNTNYRKAIEPGMRLAITLKHLTTGESYHSLSFAFRVPHNTICVIVREVCAAIIAEYSHEVVKTPQNPAEWREVARKFSSRWNFEHTLGAIDGKHVAIKKPKNSGSEYFNYKGFFSMILMALVDGDYRFMWVDVGTRATCDSAVFNASTLKESLETGAINFPHPEPLPGDNEDTPYFLVGDDAFALRTWMMKPFARRNLTKQERIFNYRLSRARRVVENTFGILANRFQVFLTTMRQEPSTVRSITLACCCLHNLMRLRYPALQNAAVDEEDIDHNVLPGAWREHANLYEVDQVVGGNLASRQAKQQRVLLKHYYNSPVGSVTWQDAMI